MKLLISFLLLVFSMLSFAKANNNSILNPVLDRDLYVSVSPFYLQYKGLKLNFERKDTSRNTSYSISPIFYFGEIENNDLFHIMEYPNKAEIAGAGLEGTYKYYVMNDILVDKFNIFIGLHSSLHYAVFTGDKEIYVEDFVDGLDVFVLEEQEVSLSATKYNFNALIGAVYVFDNYFSISGELQYGLNFSSIGEDFVPARSFESNFFHVNGNDFYIDIKFGVWLDNFF